MKTPARIGILVFVGAAMGAACTSKRSGATGQGSSGSSGGATTAGSGGSSAGGSSAGGSSAASGSGSTTGSTTGLVSPFPDGGFVFCEVLDAADAGRTGDGGAAHWLCPPGTYFCGGAGDLASCLQCRSDGDCTSSSLPTYDPDRPRCDLDSGVPGYQGFCQECLADADCAGKHVGAICDRNPDFAPGSLEPAIVTAGFETCNPQQTDCRLSEGPDCRLSGQVCDPTNGRCETPSMSCRSDADCADLLDQPNLSNPASGSPYLRAPYCAHDSDAGSGTCSPCPGGVCLNTTLCSSDADCGNPTSAPAGPSCHLLDSPACGFQRQCGVCTCANDSQCGGAWPVCRFDAGAIDLFGAVVGACTCDSASECGDAGLSCLPQAFSASFAINSTQAIPTIEGALGGYSFCGVSCASPLFSSCRAVTGYPTCDSPTGLCRWCNADEECRASFGSGGPSCDWGPFDPDDSKMGQCYCGLDADCPVDQRCVGGGAVTSHSCQPELTRCTPASCDGLFCDQDSGTCPEPRGSDEPTCGSDYECPGGRCTAAGTCGECLSDDDCVREGQTENTFCCLFDADCTTKGALSYTCASICRTDQDCRGNRLGQHCVADAGSNFQGSILQCGCRSDAECAGNPAGPRCDTDADATGLFGRCICLTAADCAVGQTCPTDGGWPTTCSPNCTADSDCQDGFFCDQFQNCLPRCDDGHACQAPDLMCDAQNRFQQNGIDFSGDVPGIDWCYQCFASSDCPPGSVCGIFQRCVAPPACTSFDWCPPGQVCLPDGTCGDTCDAGTCPAGEECDALDLAGNGPSICYACITAADCPYFEGCDSLTHTCGTCRGPTASGGPDDCPPGSICSNFWTGGVGACLPDCDVVPCPAEQPLCEVFSPLTPDHQYCFGCLDDTDCRDAGPGYWCDSWLNRTFRCQPP